MKPMIQPVAVARNPSPKIRVTILKMNVVEGLLMTSPFVGRHPKVVVMYLN